MSVERSSRSDRPRSEKSARRQPAPAANAAAKPKAKAKAASRSKPQPKPKSMSKSKGAPKPGTPAGAPVLLSGGNPQIAKGDGDAPVQAYLEALPGWKQDVGKQLDALIARVVPNVRKAVRWNTPFYGIDGQGWFLAFHCMTKYVKVAFLRGTQLQPQPPIASKNAGTRYAHVHEGERIDEATFVPWLEQAARLPGEPCF